MDPAQIDALLESVDVSDVTSGFSGFTAALETSVDEALAQVDTLPLLGDQLRDGVEPLFETLDEMDAQVNALIARAYAEAGPAGEGLLDAIEQGLLDAFGPNGLDILLDGPDAGKTIGLSDFARTSGTDVPNSGPDDASSQWVQWDVHLGQKVSLVLPFELGLDLRDLDPELFDSFDMQLDIAGNGIRFEFSWDMRIGFGINGRAEDGHFFLNSGATDQFGDPVQELRAGVEVYAAPSQDAVGQDVFSTDPAISVGAALGLVNGLAEDGTISRTQISAGSEVATVEVLAGSLVDYSNSFTLTIGEGTGTPVDHTITYSTPTNPATGTRSETFATFLGNLNATLLTQIGNAHGGVPGVIATADFSGINGLFDSEGLGGPALILTATTPRIEAMTLTFDDPDTTWGFAQGQYEDGRSQSLGFSQEQTSATGTLLADSPAPADGILAEDVNLVLVVGGTEVPVVLRSLENSDIERLDGDGRDDDDPEKVVSLIETLQIYLNGDDESAGALSQAGLARDAVEVSVDGDRLKFTADPVRSLAVRYQELDISKLTLVFSVDITDPTPIEEDEDPNPDDQDTFDRLTAAELAEKIEADPKSVSEVIVPAVNAGAQVRLHLTGGADSGSGLAEQQLGLAGGALGLPELSYDLKIDTSASVTYEKNEDTDVYEWTKTAGLDLAQFDNVLLDLGSLIESVLEPVTDVFGVAMGPVFSITGDALGAAGSFLSEPIPVLDEIGPVMGFGQPSILDLGLDATEQAQFQDFVDAISSLAEFGESLGEFMQSYNGGPLSFGCFQYDREPVTDEAGEPVIDPGSGQPQTRGALLPCELKSMVDSLDLDLLDLPVPEVDRGGFSIDMLSPTSAVRMMLGKPFDLFSFTLPSLDFTIDVGGESGGLSFDFDIVSFYIDAGATLHISPVGFVFDSTGLAQVSDAVRVGAAPDPEVLLDGFYISNEAGNEVDVEFYASGGGDFDLAVVKASADIDLAADFFFDIRDPNGDGELRLGEILTVTDGFSDPLKLVNLFDTGVGVSGGFDFSGEFCAGACVAITPDDLGLDLSFEARLRLSDIIGSNTEVPYTSSPPPIMGTTLAVGGESVLRINTGPFAGARVNDRVNAASTAGLTITVEGTQLRVKDPSSSDATLRNNGRLVEATGFDRVLVAGTRNADSIDLTGLTIPATVYGGEGVDHITGGASGDVLEGGEGDDVLVGGDGRDEIRGDAGNDDISGGDDRDVIFGDAGDDDISGGAEIDVLHGGSGIDVISGGTGNDRLFGDNGDDILKGDEDADDLRGGSGGDVLTGGDGADKLYGENGTDTLDGGDGPDTLDGGAGSDQLAGGSGSDRMVGGDGIDSMVGGGDDDTLIGGNGDDHLDGGDGDDTLDGGPGNDQMAAGAGSDRITGGLGNDQIEGGVEDHEVRGDEGTDTAVLLDNDPTATGVNATLNVSTLRSQRFDGTSVSGPLLVMAYGSLEDIAIRLGGGPDRLTIRGINVPLTVDSGGGADSITFVSLPAPTTIDTGWGEDTVTLGEGSLAAITAPLDITTGFDDDTIVIDNSIDPIGRAVTVSADGGRTTFLGLPFPSTVPSYDGTVEDFELVLGSAADTVLVEATAQGLAVDAGGGTDSIEVLSAGGALSFTGGGQDDSLSVSSAAGPGDGTVGDTALTLSSYPDGLAYSGFSRLAVLASDVADVLTVDYDLGGLALDLGMGDGADEVTIVSTGVNGSVTVAGGDGDDAVTIAELNQLRSSVDFDGGAGGDTVVIDDEDSSGTRTLEIGAAGIVVDSGREVGYRGLAGGLTYLGSAATLYDATISDTGGPTDVTLGDFGDAVHILTTSHDTTIDVGGGDNDITVAAAPCCALVIHGGDATDSLTLAPNAGGAAVGSFTDAEPSGGRLAFPGLAEQLDFDGIEAVTLDLADTSDEVTLDYTVPLDRLSYRGNGGDDTLTIETFTGELALAAGSGIDDVTLRADDPATFAGAGRFGIEPGLELLVIDTSGSSNDRDWSVSGGILKVGPTGGPLLPLLDISGADETRLDGGSGTDSLSVEEPASRSVTATIDGGSVDVLVGQDVLDPGEFLADAAAPLPLLEDIADIVTIGDFVYAVSPSTDSLIVFQRPTFEVIQVLRSGPGIKLGGASAILATNGFYPILVASRDDGVVQRFWRDASTGLLTSAAWDSRTVAGARDLAIIDGDVAVVGTDEIVVFSSEVGSVRARYELAGYLSIHGSKAGRWGYAVGPETLTLIDPRGVGAVTLPMPALFGDNGGDLAEVRTGSGCADTTFIYLQTNLPSSVRQVPVITGGSPCLPTGLGDVNDAVNLPLVSSSELVEPPETLASMPSSSAAGAASEFYVASESGEVSVFRHPTDDDPDRLVRQMFVRLDTNVNVSDMFFAVDADHLDLWIDLQSSTRSSMYEFNRIPAGAGYLEGGNRVAGADIPVPVDISGLGHLQVSEDGRFAYAAGAQRDTIEVFAVEPDGSLSFVQHVAWLDGLEDITGIAVGAASLDIAVDTPDVRYRLARSVASGELSGLSSPQTLCGGAPVTTVASSRDYRENTFWGTGTVALGVDGTDPASFFETDADAGELRIAWDSCDAGSRRTISGFPGITHLAVDAEGSLLYATVPSAGKLLVFALTDDYLRDPPYATLVQTLQDGVDGVSGLTGASGVAVSPDGSYVYVTDEAGGSISAFSVTGGSAPLVFAQGLRNGNSTSLGLDQPTSLAVVPTTGTVTTGTVLVGSAGGATGVGGLAALTYLPVQPVAEVESNDDVLTATELSANFVRSAGAEFVATATGGADGTPDYFGFFASPGDTLEIAITGDGPVSLQTAAGAVLAERAGDVLGYAFAPDDADGRFFLVVQPGGEYRLDLALTTLDGLSPQTQAAGYTLSFTSVEALHIVTQGGDDTVVMKSPPSASVTTIATGADNDTIRLLEGAGSVTVDTGPGEDVVEVDTPPGTGAAEASQAVGPGVQAASPASAASAVASQYQVRTGDGADRINVRSTQTADAVTVLATVIEAGDGADVIQVNGSRLDSSISLSGDGDADTLLFDPAGEDFEQVNGPAGAGTIGVTGKGIVSFGSLESTVVIAPPIVGVVAGATAAEGEDIDLTASVTLATAPPQWDLDGDGIFGDASGAAATVGWEALVELGIGDGDTPDGTNYVVAVRATNAEGTTQAMGVITITNVPPQVSLSAAEANVQVAEDVTIPLPTAGEIGDPGDDTISLWTVDWGDGTIENFPSDAAALSHAYESIGDFPIVVTATDEDGTWSVTGPGTVSVSAAAPDPGGPYVISEGDGLSLEATAPGTPAAFSWNLDPSVDDLFETAGASPTLTWNDLVALGIDDSGSYPIEVRVDYGGAGCSAGGACASATVSLVVENVAPSATLGNDGPVDEGGSAMVVFSSASDPSPTDAAAGFTFDYDFDNDGTFDLLDGGNVVPVPGALLGDPGVVLVRGRISDKDGGATEYLTAITVNDVPLVVSLPGAAPVAEGDVYTLDLGAAVPGGTVIVEWTIDWGDGTVDTVPGTATEATHVYADDGSFTVAATATDEDGPAIGTVTVTVENVPPTLSISGATGSVAEGDYSLTVAASDVGDDTINGWVIRWGDGSISILAGDAAGATHRFDGPGAYTITATATDEDGTYPAGNSVDVTVVNVAPTVTLSGAAAVDEAAPFTLNLAVSDPGWDTVSEWIIDWGDGSSVETVAGDRRSVVHTYVDGDNDYVIVVGAEDEDGVYPDAATLAVHVDDVAPTLTTGGPTIIREGDTYTLTLDATDPGPDVVSGWTITWGDGGLGELVIGGSGSVTHTYADDSGAGSFTITAVAVQGTEAFSAPDRLVKVLNQQPSIDLLGGQPQVDAAEPFVLTLGDVTDPGDDTVTEYRVYWGDDTTFETGDSGTPAEYQSFDVPGAVEHSYADGEDAHEIRVALVDEDGVAPAAGRLSMVNEGGVYRAAFGPELAQPDDRYVADWGDGTSDTYTNADGVVPPGEDTLRIDGEHVYADSGIYTLQIFRETGGSQTLVGSRPIVVHNVAPVPTINGAPTVGPEGTAIDLFATVVDPGSADILTSAWLVTRDGEPYESGTGDTFRFTPDDEGEYVVTLTVTDDDGASRSDSVSISVENVGPLIEVDEDTVTVAEGGIAANGGTVVDQGDDTVVLSASVGSVGDDGDGSWSWSYDAGDGPDESQTVTITATDDVGASNSITFDLVVENMAPIVAAGADVMVAEGSSVSLTPATFTDAGPQDTHSATIDWGDGTAEVGVVTGAAGSGTVAGVHVFADDGTYAVTVCVTDNDGAFSCDTLLVTVENAAPIVFAGTDRLVIEDNLVTLASLGFTDPGTLDTHIATIDWGDGTAAETAVVSESPFGPPGSTAGADGTVSGNHSYADAGVYIVTVCVTDDDAATGCDTVELTVAPGFVRYAAFAMEDKSVTVGESAIVDGDLAANGKIHAKKNSTITGGVTSAGGDVKQDDGAGIGGSLTAGGKVDLGKGATVGGDVSSGNDVKLKADATVGGDVTATGTVKLASGASVGGRVAAETEVPVVAPVTPVTLSVTAGEQDVEVAKNTTLELAPGSYRKLKVKQGATLTLGAGVYVFADIDLDRGATLVLEIGEGTVLIDVAGNVQMDREVQMTTTGDPSDILFRVAGKKLKLAQDGVFLGTYLVPNGVTELSEGAVLAGALWGADVKIGKAATLTMMPAVELFAGIMVP